MRIARPTIPLLLLLALTLCWPVFGESPVWADSKSAKSTRKGSKSKRKKHARKRNRAGRPSKKERRARARRKRARARARAKRRKSRRKKTAKQRSGVRYPAGWTWPPDDAMKAEGTACKKHLTELGIEWKSVDVVRNVATSIEVPSLEFGGVSLEPVFRKPPFVMDCHLAVALVEVADELSSIGIKTLRFSSIHDFRRVRIDGKVKNRLSRHAFGLAVDVYELVTTSGETLVVEDSFWHPSLVFIRAHRLLAEHPAFSVLSPLNNASHHDHFHLEAAVGRFR